jgi:carbon monoxide dehydrogenase subunit G
MPSAEVGARTAEGLERSRPVELKNEFSLGVPIDQAWAVLTDLQRVAPCMPGFELQEVEGEEYRGAVRVKVGPVVAQYRGVASFRERDEASHRAVVRAEGREIRGQGGATATVTATLAPGEGGTQVTLHTDLTITGRVAQFGRGVLADVSSKLLREFVQALEADVLKGAAVGEGASADRSPAKGAGTKGEPSVSAGPRRIGPAAGKPVDLLAAAAPSVLRRVGPIVAALVVALVVASWLLFRG